MADNVFQATPVAHKPTRSRWRRVAKLACRLRVAVQVVLLVAAAAQVDKRTATPACWTPRKKKSLTRAWQARVDPPLEAAALVAAAQAAAAQAAVELVAAVQAAVVRAVVVLARLAATAPTHA